MDRTMDPDRLSREDRRRWVLRRWPAPESRSIESRAVGIRPVGETKILKGPGSRETLGPNLQSQFDENAAARMLARSLEEPVLRAGRHSCDETRGRRSAGGFTWVVYLTRGRISRGIEEGEGKGPVSRVTKCSPPPRNRLCGTWSSERRAGPGHLPLVLAVRLAGRRVHATTGSSKS